MKLIELRALPQGALVAYQGQPAIFKYLIGGRSTSKRPRTSALLLLSQNPADPTDWGALREVSPADVQQVTAGGAVYDREKDRLPYGPESAIYVESPGHVEVFWTADPAIAARLASGDTTDWDRLGIGDYTIEHVAVARLFTRAAGATFSGWVIESGSDFSDAYRTKPAAMDALRAAVADYWNR